MSCIYKGHCSRSLYSTQHTNLPSAFTIQLSCNSLQVFSLPLLGLVGAVLEQLAHVLDAGARVGGRGDDLELIGDGAEDGGVGNRSGSGGGGEGESEGEGGWLRERVHADIADTASKDCFRSWWWYLGR